MILLDSGGGETPFDLVVAQMGRATSEYTRAFAAFKAILRDSTQTELIEIVD